MNLNIWITVIFMASGTAKLINVAAKIQKIFFGIAIK